MIGAASGASLLLLGYPMDKAIRGLTVGMLRNVVSVASTMKERLKQRRKQESKQDKRKRRKETRLPQVTRRSAAEIH